MSPASVHSGHRTRSSPVSVEVARNTWLWVARVPYLPDIGNDRDQVATPISILGYHALAESVAANAAEGSAVQIRLLARGVGGDPGTVEPFFVGRSRTRQSADRLAALVRATVPPEVPLDWIQHEDDVAAVLDHIAVADGPVAAVAEIRRRIEELDSVPGGALQSVRTTPGMLRWAPDPVGLRTASSVLARHSTPAVIVLHLEPATPSLALLDSLDAVVRETVSGLDPADNPLRRSVAGDNLRRLRSLPRAALEVRVAVAARDNIEPGLLESVGISLTAEEAFVAVRPRDDRELLLAGELFATATARRWGGTGDAVSDELSGLCDSAEAAAVVRLPTPLRGGSPGLASIPLSTLPRSALMVDDQAGDGVHLGPGSGGGQVGLSLDELNRHLLVAGLPGFGKTVTVQRLLARLWRGHRTPFLVLDPAKSDYEQLVAELGDDVLHVRLGPDVAAFNPFAVPAGCTPHAHAGRVLAAFDSAFGLSTSWPLGYVTLARGLFAAYETAGEDRAPTLRSVYAQVGDTLRRSAFAGPDGVNARAALLARLEFLSRGPLGAALLGGPDDGPDWSALLARPVVVEMRSFGGPAERALMFALLLAGLISFRENNPLPGGLGHVTVLEEAHRVLRETQQESEGVRLFVEAIAELRGSGEGFVIVDQAPTMLHPGVLKLSGSVLTHRLIDPHERAIIGAAVLLDERQQQDLARLETGQAVVFSSRRATSVVVDVEARDDAAPGGSLEVATRAPARALVPAARVELPFCIGCLQMCRHETQARRLVAHKPAPDGSAAQLWEHFAAQTVDPGLARCAAGMALAASWQGTVPRFLTEVRELDDALTAHVRNRAAD